ncbi:hypothetical protein [Candidatus Methylacidithermus pantelleriae]|uniref:Uncharacterized protein n=1 Tax=Candidatus Methylacidithermus pantelleriae TaxID=2744239 RepID=A0A8J2BJZ5_9BACT|nr:hypothetical protein [Candidatus Methylacidithermus pantelleriae]CAF0694473.1 hypothetical protein MPNT_160065 [Candidatus Methylacidithermus pantelleriae]
MRENGQEAWQRNFGYLLLRPWRISSLFALAFYFFGPLQRASPLDLSTTTEAVPGLGSTEGPLPITRESSEFQKAQSLLRVDWLNLDCDLQVDTYYDSNIFGRFRDLVGDFVTRVNGGFLLGLGDTREKKRTYLSLLAAPGGVLYWDHGDLDYFNRSVLLNGAWITEKLRFELSGGYQKYLLGVQDLSTFAVAPLPVVALPEVLRLVTTHAEYMPIMVRTTYDITPRIRLDWDGAYEIYNFDSGIPDVKKERIGGGVLYQAFAKTQIGIYGRAGVLHQVANPQQDWQTVGGRIVYQYGPKTSLTAGGGVAFLATTGGVQKTIGVFSLGCRYVPTEKILLDFRGYRDFDPSLLFGSQDFIVTGGEIRLGWKLSERWMASVYGIAQELSYFTTNRSLPLLTAQARVFGAWPELAYSFEDRYKLRVFIRWSQFEIPAVVEDWQGGVSVEVFF